MSSTASRASRHTRGPLKHPVAEPRSLREPPVPRAWEPTTSRCSTALRRTPNRRSEELLAGRELDRAVFVDAITRFKADEMSERETRRTTCSVA